MHLCATNQTNSGHLLHPRATETFTFDADGNQTADSLWTNAWDGENRLLATESAAAVPSGGKARQTWTLDGQSRWVQRVVHTWTGSAYAPSATNRFVWDGNVLLAILDHTNGLVTSFLRGLDLSGTPQGAGDAGGVVAVTFGPSTLTYQPSTHFVAYDGNGNVAALFNAVDGTPSARYEYEPFGRTLRATGPAAEANPLRFSTQWEDDVSGSLKYLFRDLRSEMGRWGSRDPIGEKGAVNLFNFVRDSPNNIVDAFGQRCCLFTYRPGDDGSRFGHSILACGDSNTVYVSLFPRGWHHPTNDAAEYPTSIPLMQCTDCLDEARIAQWLIQARQNPDPWNWLNNCANATLAAITAGLPTDRQNRPRNCPCPFLLRVVGCVPFVRDLLAEPPGGHAPGVCPILFPWDVRGRFQELIDNGCNRWKCDIRCPRPQL